MESASMTTAPRSDSSRATVLFPAPMPPVRPTSSTPLLLLFGTTLEVGDDRFDRLLAERLRFPFRTRLRSLVGFCRYRSRPRFDLRRHRSFEHIFRRRRTVRNRAGFRRLFSNRFFLGCDLVV